MLVHIPDHHIAIRATDRQRISDGSADAGDKFVKDFVAAWTKVMNLDRFDIA